MSSQNLANFALELMKSDKNVTFFSLQNKSHITKIMSQITKIRYYYIDSLGSTGLQDGKIMVSH